jgi:hypothetical protein
MFAGQVTMAKTEHSMAVGRLTTSAGRVTVFIGEPPLPILRLTMFAGKLAAGVGRVGLSAVRGRGWFRLSVEQIFDKGFTPFHSHACAAMIGAFATVPSAVNMISPTRHYDRCA